MASSAFNLPKILTVTPKPVTFTYTNYGLWSANLTSNEYIIRSQTNYQVEGGISSTGGVNHSYRIATKNAQGGSWTDIPISPSPITINCVVMSVR